MAAISPDVAPVVAILPTNNDMMVCDDDAKTMMQTDAIAPSSSMPTAPAVSSAVATTRIADESTQVALDALAALASASTAVSSSSVSSDSTQQELLPSQLLRPQEITPHQTSSDDDSSEIMPPPPPRSPNTMRSSTSLAYPTSAPPAVPSFTFLHDHESYNYNNENHFGNNLGNNAGGSVGGGRLRSASNPEGMEKWDFYSRRNDRQHFVLPSSILEEELASTRRVLGEVVDEGSGEYNTSDDAGIQCSGDTSSDSDRPMTNQHGFTSQYQQPNQNLQHHQSKPKKTDASTGFQQHWVRRSKRSIAARFGTSPDSVSSDFDLEEIEDVPQPPSFAPKSTATKSKAAKSSGSNKSSNGNHPSPSPASRKKSTARSTTMPPPSDIISSQSPPPDEEDEDEVDESTLEPEELLRRARSRLLEDLSEGSGGGGGNGLNGEKGGSVLILPHSLSKYKEVYNKNGRIGIYTPAERAAIIQKFNAKRARRVWNKKIRYNCRKNLADRRMRVKGRFVKRSVESAGSPPLPSEEERGTMALSRVTKERKRVASIKAKASSSRSISPPTVGSPLPTVREHDEQPLLDEDMPDVEDEEAGFEPSEDMPYRRARRYTIT
mmetsp:Transcript_25606/g.53474  ORF Transcript_25606/g.53474 Transcript_25606/m.53474 type:complete len:607 (+) Transcript_25606:183-2003(+)